MTAFLDYAVTVTGSLAGAAVCLVLVFVPGITRRSSRLSSRPTDTKERRNA